MHPQRLLEVARALNHQVGTQVQRACLRTDFLEQLGNGRALGGAFAIWDRHGMTVL